jgi:hypothetical protein
MMGQRGNTLLRAKYVLNNRLDAGQPVVVKESRGTVRVELSPTEFSPAACAALNAVTEQLLAGGQWFQVWRGEIVSMESPEDPRQGGTVARIHRGPVVHEAS